jgi:hypothetical protein
LQPYLQEGRHEMCSFIFVNVWCNLLVSMDPEVVIGYISDSSEDVEVVTTCSSRCSAVGRIEPSGLSISSDSDSALGLADSASNYPQNTDNDALAVCPTCSSFYEGDTQCPLC